MSEISTNQARAIAALLSEPTTEKAADSAGVTSRTIRRWMSDSPSFRHALAEAEAAAVRDAARGIAGGAVEAAAFLRGVVADESAETRERIMAARILLARLPDFRLAVLEARLAAMEDKERGRRG